MGVIVKWDYIKNPHQQEFHDNVISRRLHLSSGFGAGKTYALCMKTFQLSWLNRDIPGGLVSESYAEFKKDWLPLFEEILDAHEINFTYKQNGKYGPHFKFPWTDATIFITTAEKKIRGPNWGWCCINELTLMPLVRYKEAMSRVRIKKAPFPQIASSGTPEGFASEYYEYLIEKPPRNTKVIYGDSRDNQMNLSADYLDDLEEAYDSIMQDAYIRGLWVNMTGNRFYYAYDAKRNNAVHKTDKYDWFHVGLDFNVDPMAASIWQWRGGILKGIDEICIPGGQKGADTRMMGKALLARGYGPHNTRLYPDPSGNSRSTKGDPDIYILREEFGFTEICVRKRAPGFRQRQLHMNNLIDKRIIQPNGETQPKTCKDLLSVEQNIITLEKIKTNPKLTHFSDGLDYLCDILIPFKKPEHHVFEGRRI